MKSACFMNFINMKHGENSGCSLPFLEHQGNGANYSTISTQLHHFNPLSHVSKPCLITYRISVSAGAVLTFLVHKIQSWNYSKRSVINGIYSRLKACCRKAIYETLRLLEQRAIGSNKNHGVSLQSRKSMSFV